MDPITTAVLAALAVGVTGGIAEAGKKVILDAYDALKAAIRRKYGNDNKVVKAIDDLENEPDFEPYRAGLHQRVKAVKADEDHDILKVAEDLLSKINSQPVGKEIIQNVQIVHGDYNAVAGAGGHATVNVDLDTRKKR